MGLVSIICPTYNEEPFIEACIQSVLAQDLPCEQWELLLVDGGSTDQTRTLIVPYLKRHTNIRLLDNPHRTVPYAMNIGIHAAQGEYVCRIDAHAAFPTNYISTLLRYTNELPNVANVGTACFTMPRNDSDKARAIVYDERLTRNQDIELNKRIALSGGKIYLIPDITCTYYARDTFSRLAQNNFANGKWNILTVYYTKTFRSLGLRHFIPLLFVLSLFTGISIALYLIVMSVIALRLSATQDLHFGYVLWAFIVLHICYGTGSLVGLLELPFVK